MSGPQIAWLADGRRLHMNHGPIDLVVEAFGAEAERQAAYARGAARFETVLAELVEELEALRRPCGPVPRRFRRPTARRMERAACRLAESFITPMAAVAGAVADEVLAAMAEGRRLARAYVNNGGDIALHIAEGESFDVAIAGTGDGLSGRVRLCASDPVRGVATSGWRGRSHSLGIADAVTVLAADGAAADAAATLIANAVDLPGHPAIARRPARELAPDSDLGDMLVTVDVGPLAGDEIAAALQGGMAVAEDFRRRGLIEAAALFLQGQALHVAPLWPAGHLPHSGGDRPSPRLSPIAEGRAPSSQPPISPRVGEMAGRPEGGDVERGRFRPPRHANAKEEGALDA